MQQSLNYSFYPKSKMIIIVYKKIQIIRKTMLLISTRSRCSTGQVKFRVNLSDYFQNLVLQRVQLLKVIVWIIHNIIRDVFQEARSPGNQNHACGSQNGYENAIAASFVPTWKNPTGARSLRRMHIPADEAQPNLDPTGPAQVCRSKFLEIAAR